MAKGLYGGECIELHHAFITDRGGKRRVGELVDLSQVRWDRRRDEVSEASLLISASACSRQARTLEQIEPKRSELVIYRGDERVWEGPIGRVGWHQNYVEVAARDVLDYAFGRPLTKDWDNSIEGDGPIEVTTRMQNIFNYELTNPFDYLASDDTTVITVPAWEDIDPPINVLPFLVVHHEPNEARTSAWTQPFQMSVGEHLDNYARTGGIDYTVVGRAIHIWDVSRYIGKTRMLTEADFFGEVIVTAYGADFAAVAFTVADDGSYGGAGESNGYYGPWTKIFTVYDEENSDSPTQAELNSQALRNLYGRSPVPIEVRVPDNSGIRLSPGLTIDHLVPGTQIPLLATLNSRNVAQMQKLHLLTVTETTEGETIQVTLVPATRPDSDVVEPEPEE